jgi:hypothetical protein
MVVSIRMPWDPVAIRVAEAGFASGLLMLGGLRNNFILLWMGFATEKPLYAQYQTDCADAVRIAPKASFHCPWAQKQLPTQRDILYRGKGTHE